MRTPKILLIKPPLDDHDRPIYDLIVPLRKAGIDPIWTGLQQPWSQIVKTALEEDADAIGVSVHTGDPAILLGKLKTELERAGLSEKILVAGGSGEITLPDMQAKLAGLGYKVFLSGDAVENIGAYIMEKFRENQKCSVSITEHFESRLSRHLLAKHITRLENINLTLVPPPKKKSFRVLLAGPAGAGKSSLLNKILEKLELREIKIGVMLCDPRGPKEKGAFLGDRVWMQERTLSENIFIRSFSQLSNYSRRSVNFLKKVSDLFALWGADITFLETIGMGQESAARLGELADLFIWVALPNETDSMRLMKGGAHELADLVLLNKIDKEPSFKAELALKQHFQNPYFKVSAHTGEGIDEVCEFILEKIKNNPCG
ncbi:hypothetical protein HYT01_00060 [Candidatus Giovannonibacteria bacterium]|nr:hypothetical protein [Candidatus Giovannonibacteria bacterium]